MKKVKLTSVCRPKQWKSIPISELSDVGYPVYGANGVIGYYDSYNHEQETVIITCRGATCGTVNLTHPRSYVTGNAMCLDNVKDSVDIKYLFYSMQAYDFTKVISGTAQPQITRVGLEKVEITLPSLDVQREIVSILDKINALIEQRRLQLKKLEELVKARFVEMFGDPVSNSKGLQEATLPEIGIFGRGVSKHRPRNDPKLLGGKYPLIQTGDVATADLYILSYTSTYSDIGLAQSKIWNKGTLCITIAANIAKTAILDFDACFPDSVVGFMANDKTNNVYIHYWFSFFQRILEEQAPESAQKNINLKVLSELKVICPEKEEQDKFADFVAQIDKSKATVQKALDETQLLFDSLMQKYFG